MTTSAQEQEQSGGSDALLELSMAYMHNPRLQPLLDGQVRPAGLSLSWELGNPNDLHLRHLRDDTFDAFEMSLAAYMSVVGQPNAGGHAWTGVPIFLQRAWLGVGMLVNTRSGIRGLADLRGKRFGVPDFGMTAAVWLRIMLREVYGITLGEMVWVNGRAPENRQDFAVGAKPPRGVEVHDKPEGRTLQQMLDRGEVDAAFGDSANADISESSTARRLLTPREGRDALIEFWRKTGAMPINHTLILQERLASAYPGLARRLFDALERSKQVAYEQEPGACALLPGDDTPCAQQMELLVGDPFPSGLAANRRSLQLLGDQLAEEGQIERVPDPAELFVTELRTT